MHDSSMDIESFMLPKAPLSVDRGITNAELSCQDPRQLTQGLQSVNGNRIDSTCATKKILSISSQAGRMHAGACWGRCKEYNPNSRQVRKSVTVSHRSRSAFCANRASLGSNQSRRDV